MRSLLRSFGLALVLAAAVPVFGAGCADDSGTDVADATQGAGKFEIFTGVDGDFYFQLLAGNGEKVLRSEGYTSLSGCKNGIESVIKNGKTASRFKVLAAVNGEHYFNLVAGNNQVIGTSETYASKSNAERAVSTVMSLLENVSTAQLPGNSPKFETFRGADGYYFRLRAKNGQIVLQSEGYASKAGAQGGVDSVKDNGSHAEQYEVLEAKNGQHYFRLAATNGELIGRSEMYASKYNAKRGAETVREIIRSMTNTTPTDDDIREAIEVAADGASYTSESDYPFTYVEAALSSPDEVIDEALVRRLMAPYVDGDEDTDKPLADLYADEGSWSEWKQDPASCAAEDDAWYRELCEEQAVLDAALEQNLTDIKVFYFGAYGGPGYVDGVAVSIIIVGRTPNGTLAGVRTIAIWT